MTFQLPDLPYSKTALQPHISSNTLDYHHGKHHKKYVDTLNSLIEGTDLASKNLEEIIKQTANDNSKASIFNNAAQVWNHTFYWNCLSPNGGGKPTGKLLAAIEENFDSYADFAKKFKEAAGSQFGSGWAWLVKDGDKLEVVKTPNAENPITKGKIPLLTCDVWEHAYYLDYQNARPDYVNTFLEELVNWEFVAENFESA